MSLAQLPSSHGRKVVPDGRRRPSPGPLVFYLHVGNAHTQTVVWQQMGFGDLFPVDQRTVSRFKVSYYESLAKHTHLAVNATNQAIRKTDVSAGSTSDESWQPIDEDSCAWAAVDKRDLHGPNTRIIGS